MDPDGNHEGLAIPSLSWVAPVKISSAQKTPGRFQFSFNTTPGYTYTVQYLNSLGLSNQWTNLATTNGIGITTNATVADPSLSASRFYRVARHPTP